MGIREDFPNVMNVHNKRTVAADKHVPRQDIFEFLQCIFVRARQSFRNDLCLAVLHFKVFDIAERDWLPAVFRPDRHH